MLITSSFCIESYIAQCLQKLLFRWILLKSKRNQQGCITKVHPHLGLSFYCQVMQFYFQIRIINRNKLPNRIPIIWKSQFLYLILAYHLCLNLYMNQLAINWWILYLLLQTLEQSMNLYGNWNSLFQWETLKSIYLLAQAYLLLYKTCSSDLLIPPSIRFYPIFV